MNPFTALKTLSSFHFTSLHFLFTYPINTSLHFTLLFVSTTQLPLTSLPFTFYHLHFPSLVFTFLTLVLKICVLSWEVPVAPSGSRFQSVEILKIKHLTENKDVIFNPLNAKVCPICSLRALFGAHHFLHVSR